MNEKLKEKYQRFLEWQQQPHQVKPLSEEEHDCNTCHTHYKGNYCPRCGQASSISRYSFKKAFLLFLDVWGLGNRGMYHSIRDLFLRPGYMVRDYLSGMQSAYFPPFKMLFLLTALLLLVNTGFNIQGKNLTEQEIEAFKQDRMEDFHQGVEDASYKNESGAMQTAQERPAIRIKNVESTDKKTSSEKKDRITELIETTLNSIYEWSQTHITISMLFSLLCMATPLYFRFRHCPNIPDLRFSEFVVAMTYVLNVSTIIMIVLNFFCLGLESTDDICAIIVSVITFKQLSGYGWWRTIYKHLITILIFGLLVVVAAILAVVSAVLVF